MSDPRPPDETTPVTVAADDEGGDPACWAHLFADDNDDEADEPNEPDARRPSD